MNGNCKMFLKDGSMLDCKIISFLKHDNINYVIYEYGDDLCAARYVLQDNNLLISEIESDLEYDYIDNYLAKLGDSL